MLTVSNCTNPTPNTFSETSSPEEIDITPLFENSNYEKSKDTVIQLYNHALQGDERCVELLQNVAIRRDEIGLFAESKLLQIIQSSMADKVCSHPAEVVQRCAQKVVMTGLLTEGKQRLIDINALYQTDILKLAGTVLPGKSVDSIPEVIKSEIARTGCKFEGQPRNDLPTSWVPSAQPKCRIAYLNQFTNTCPERCAVFIAKRFGCNCEFTHFNSNNTGQIDIFPPLTKYSEPSDRDILFTDGRNANSVMKLLGTLDRNGTYIMRTGENDDGGHYQCLYHDHGEWHVYDSMKNRAAIRMTSNGGLTNAGKAIMIDEHGNWGANDGQRSIAIAQVTKEGVMAFIHFIKDWRNFGEEVAIRNLSPRHEQLV
ncbi:hypothetical protein JQC92_22135 [Shewanella sp. 202IG2-18]|uniref:hypothetical protein n=1 Tax=Parashewanella hymeniacidonis TaxID=2807618 RepID=UPI0019621CDD|nr:hypothetical protein [Parashewanella hymeniacidonis]MBM7074675.1 hypothetical protein [Parashewanella hymeniacidonis]